MENIENDIIEALESFKDIKRFEFSKNYYPTAMRVIGVTVPNSRIVLKELKYKTIAWPDIEKIQLAKKLIESNIFECQQIAFEFVAKDKKTLKKMTHDDFIELGKNLDNWISVDTYSIYLLGYAWRNGIIDDVEIKSFLKSTNHWRRRIAVVATVGLNLKSHGGKGDAKRTIEICELVVHDHHQMIVKALSWALRELSKREKLPVQGFIEKYHDQLHSKVIREVTTKLETGKKNGVY